MTASGPAGRQGPVRRPPPPFRRVTVRRTESLSPRMVRVTLGGSELDGLVVDEPGASVRLLLPSPGKGELIIPEWNGNEFLLPDGIRPVIRTFTPRRVDPVNLELDLDIVLHEGGIASGWAESATAGAPAAISGPGRGYVPDEEAESFLLGGDESAIPAISQLLEAIPQRTPVVVHIEIVDPDARLALPDHPKVSVSWHPAVTGGRPGDALVAAIEGTGIAPGTRIWVAGEAAAVHRIRRNLFEQRGIPRSQATVRGYWKHTGDDAGLAPPAP
ncbi:MAG TPA: siderophore-interacting protein [Acidimicrobiia bacterium]|nr:siderophore-interacting protein [Acidimicrobiia bacterium]